MLTYTRLWALKINELKLELDPLINVYIFTFRTIFEVILMSSYKFSTSIIDGVCWQKKKIDNQNQTASG